MDSTLVNKRCCLLLSVALLLWVMAPNRIAIAQNKVSGPPIPRPPPSSALLKEDTRKFNHIAALTQTLTEQKITGMSNDDPDLFELYSQRIAGADDSIPWVILVDRDILNRRNSVDLLSRLLREPKYLSNRSALFGWIADHPKYPGAQVILEQAVALFRASKLDLDYDKFHFPEMVAAVGDARHAAFFDELQRAFPGGFADSAKARFEKRMSTMAQQPQDITTDPLRSATSGQPSPSTPTQAKSSDLQPASTPWLVWAVVGVAATGLLWLLLKNRK
jgi:hypothetical protein